MVILSLERPKSTNFQVQKIPVKLPIYLRNSQVNTQNQIQHNLCNRPTNVDSFIISYNDEIEMGRWP